jgi:hypothetical protein
MVKKGKEAPSGVGTQYIDIYKVAFQLMQRSPDTADGELFGGRIEQASK